MGRKKQTNKEEDSQRDVILPDDVVFCDFGGAVQRMAQERLGREFCRPCASMLHHRGYLRECISLDREMGKEKGRS